jgi:Protein of unknown function (DUF4238)
MGAASNGNLTERSAARIQHYVPRFLLNSFARPVKGKKLQISVFDKHESRGFTTAVDNVFGERDFNTFSSDVGTICLEDALGRVVTAVAPIISRIVRLRRIELSEEEVVTLAFFVALMQTRTTGFRKQIEGLTNDIRELVASNFQSEALSEIDRSMAPNAIKLLALGFMVNSAYKFAPLIVAKTLVLFSDRRSSLIIGDTPIVFHNDRDFGPYGNIGLAVPGIQIYLPLSADLALGFLCPSIIEEWEKQARTVEQQKAQVAGLAIVGAPEVARRAKQILAQFEAASAKAKKLAEDVRLGNSVECSVENVSFLNSLQIGFAERYVASATGNFDLVERMIEDREEHRRGRRMKVN